MRLPDKDILKLNELCNAVIDGTIDEQQKAELSDSVMNSLEARQFYIRAMAQSASLYSYASEMQSGEADNRSRGGKVSHVWRNIVGILAIAALIAIVMWINPRKQRAPQIAQAAIPSNDDEFVARLTGSKQSEWVDSRFAIAPGARLRKGQHLELAAGFAEITFDCGAQLVLKGPASLDVNSAWNATLNKGNLQASLPPEAMGFSISNPTVEVVDLGTEFTMFADASGAATEVLVLKGEVEAAPRLPADQQPIVLREKESRRFATAGVSTVHDSAQKFQALTQSVELDHFISPTGYAHWSFDETEGDLFKADASGLPLNAPDAQLQNVASSALAAAHVKGRWGQALRFDGHLYAQAAFPGISENSPHTAAFWVKVPVDAKNDYAMVAWGVNDKKLGSHPVHIGWNRNRTEGMLGALRTDYGGGFAIGTTSLRDGHWHHVAVVLIPRNDPSTPMEVKQYVDGRLEGEGKPSTPGSDIFTYSNDKNARATNGTIWLGSRLGLKGVRAARFLGEMDELFIADRALEPHEIVRLMNDNRL